MNSRDVFEARAENAFNRYLESPDEVTGRALYEAFRPCLSVWPGIAVAVHEVLLSRGHMKPRWPWVPILPVVNWWNRKSLRKDTSTRYDDYLVARWQLTRERTILEEILDRAYDERRPEPDRQRVLNNGCEQNPEFREAVIEALKLRRHTNA